uniref:Uncharacterized protein n=1 Tax=Arundo donax TaxID=35708 RepID=A0A0A8YQ13_ARUDO
MRLFVLVGTRKHSAMQVSSVQVYKFQGLLSVFPI